MKCKPENAKDNEFWWETKNTKVRLECFSFMIEETEKKQFLIKKDLIIIPLNFVTF